MEVLSYDQVEVLIKDHAEVLANYQVEMLTKGPARGELTKGEAYKGLGRGGYQGPGRGAYQSHVEMQRGEACSPGWRRE